MRLNKKQCILIKEVDRKCIPLELRYKKNERFALVDYDLGRYTFINSLDCIQKIFYSDGCNGWRLYAPLKYKAEILGLAAEILGRGYPELCSEAEHCVLEELVPVDPDNKTSRKSL